MANINYCGNCGKEFTGPYYCTYCGSKQVDESGEETGSQEYLIEDVVEEKPDYSDKKIGSNCYERCDGTTYSYDKWGAVVNDTGHDRAF